MALKLRVTNVVRQQGWLGDDTLESVAVTAEVYDDANPATVLAGPMTRTFAAGTTRAGVLRALVDEFRQRREANQRAVDLAAGATVDAT